MANKVGQGTFGSVFRTSPYSVKKEAIFLDYNNLNDDFTIIDNVLREACFYKLVYRLRNDPFIDSTTNLFNHVVPSSIADVNLSIEDNKIIFDMPFLGSPFYNTKLNNHNLIKCFSQIVESISWLHKAGISHGDIKPENMLYFKNSLKTSIIDFGSICFFHHELFHFSNQRCTITYVSPEELFDIKKMSIKSDIFSLGILLFEVVTGQKFIIELLKLKYTSDDYISKFYDAICKKNTTTGFDPMLIMKNLYKSISFSDIREIVEKKCTNRDIQRILLHCLLLEPSIRASINHIKCDTIIMKYSPTTSPMQTRKNSQVFKQKLKSVLLSYNDLKYGLQYEKRLSNLQYIAKLCTKFKIFGQELFGHSVMLFDRYQLKINEDQIESSVRLISIICIIVSSCILKASTITGQFICSITNISLQEFIKQFKSFLTVMDFNIFNLSPDLIYLKDNNILPTINKQISIYKDYPVIHHTVELLREKFDEVSFG